MSSCRADGETKHGDWWSVSPLTLLGVEIVCARDDLARAERQRYHNSAWKLGKKYVMYMHAFAG